jgi:hypothetical protein
MLRASVGKYDNGKTFAGYSKHFWSATVPKDRWNELVWVNRWYNPDDNRNTTPAQRHKFLSQPQPDMMDQSHWIQAPSTPINTFTRSSEEKYIYQRGPRSRCEQWSTLRQMLPSKGHEWPANPPKWGNNYSIPPPLSARRPSRYPHINSPMTNYIDDMHRSNKMFRLY